MAGEDPSLDPTARTRRAQTEREERRAQLLEAARTVFARKGYHEAGVADIIELAGSSRWTFYAYFESKRAIFDELIDRFLMEIRGRFRRITQFESPASIRQQMAGIVYSIVDYLESERDLLKILVETGQGSDPGIDAKIQAFYDQMEGYISNALEIGIRLGIVRKLNSSTAARAIHGMLVMNLYLAYKKGGPVDSRKILTELLELALDGIRGPALGERSPSGGVAETAPAATAPGTPDTARGTGGATEKP